MYYKNLYHLAVEMLDDGMSPMEIAESLHVDFQLVLEIQQDFEQTMRAYG